MQSTLEEKQKSEIQRALDEFSRTINANLHDKINQNSQKLQDISASFKKLVQCPLTYTHIQGVGCILVKKDKKNFM